MACTEPITTSPGRLILYYIKGGIGERFSTSFKFISGVVLTDIADIRTEAERIAGLMAVCLPVDTAVTDWAIGIGGTGIFYAEAFGAPFVGSHTIHGQMQAWLSTTVALVGTGNQSAPGICHGNITARMHTFGTINFAPGTRFYNSADDSAYSHLVSGLNASTYLPADGYGQQGDIRTILAVQWNAATQDRLGS
jgi:hypothetical protein